MPKVLRRTLLILSLLIIFILSAAIIVAGLFEERIGQTLTEEINKQLTSEFTISDFELSLLKGFPSASAGLKDVRILDTREKVLLEAEEMAFRFSLLSLFGSKIKINSILIRDGGLNIYIDRRGHANYDITKPNEAPTEETESADLAIVLKEARLVNMEVFYRSVPDKQRTRVLLDDLALSGDFSSTKFDLESTAEIQSRYIELDGDQYLAQKSIGYDAKIAVDMDAETYDFDRLQLRIEENTFNLSGNMAVHEEETDYDILATIQEGSLEGVLQLLPASYMSYVGDLKTRGTFEFEAKVKGTQTQRVQPEIIVTLGFRDGRLTSSYLDAPLKDLSFDAEFTNGKYRTAKSSILKIPNFRGSLDGEPIRLALQATNLEDPDIRFDLDGALSMEAAFPLFGGETVTDGSGKIEIRDLNIDGRYNDMIRGSRINRVKAKGQLIFDRVELTMNQKKLRVNQGNLKLEGNELAVQNMFIEGPGSEIQLNGTFNNILPVLLADSTNSKKAELNFKSNLYAPKLDIDELISLTESPVEEGMVSASTYDSIQVAEVQQREFFTNFLDGYFNAKIDEFNYGEIEGKNFEGSLKFVNNEMIIKGTTNAMEGRMELEGDLFFEDRPKLQLTLDCQNINATEFFRQTENFGQDYLTNEHVSGTLNAKAAIFADFDQYGNFLYDKLLVFAGIGIEDGRLQDFEMLEDFSSLIKIEDLRDIRFSNMENWLLINKGNLTIPALFIQSNAINLTVSGEQSFAGDMEYFIKVNAGQVVANKLKRFNPDLNPIEAKQQGMFNMYFKIFGDLETFDFKTSKREAKDAFAASEKDKNKIREALIKAFGSDVQLISEPPEWADIPDYTNYDEEEEETYLEGF
ncbi:MAG: AsmA-like C-terminal region-containing protein [Bacteroidota bacterium]